MIVGAHVGKVHTGHATPCRPSGSDYLLPKSGSCLLVVALDDRRAAAVYSRSSWKQNNKWGDLAKMGAEQVGVHLLRLLQPESYLRENR